ncbi:Uncharacterized protein DBV15_05118 [Temnothorax longispinosus]|uniref:Uncharacterized protein n=1 Tax=Temnothorax longispinosus TaxID=300112 RepID=A0A4S2KUB1_9HYME|nr:Uncharacterized protein DBV15_05118 [Temnothorax longispinosus]
MATASKIDGRKGSEIARVMAEVVAHNIGETRTRGRNKTLARKSEHGRRLVNRKSADQSSKVTILSRKPEKGRD